MDPVTHTLTGWTLARTGIAGDTRPALAAVTAASLLPDVDIVHLLGGVESYIRHGGSWSHSVFGAGVLGLAAGAAFWYWSQKRGTPVPLLRVSLAMLTACWLHVALDWATPIGIRLLYPFRKRLFALDWMPMTDLLLLVVFAVSLFLPWLFGLIQEEIGARRGGPPPRWGAWLALFGLLLIVAGRSVAHSRAMAAVDRYDFGSGSPERTAVFPTSANPLRWLGVADTGDQVYLLQLNLVTRQGPQPEILFKPPESPPLDIARETGSAKVFLSRARFPVARVTREGDDWKVVLEDMICGEEEAFCPKLTAIYRLDHRLQITEEKLRW